MEVLTRLTLSASAPPSQALKSFWLTETRLCHSSVSVVRVFPPPLVRFSFWSFSPTLHDERRQQNNHVRATTFQDNGMADDYRKTAEL